MNKRKPLVLAAISLIFPYQKVVRLHASLYTFTTIIQCMWRKEKRSITKYILHLLPLTNFIHYISSNTTRRHHLFFTYVCVIFKPSTKLFCCGAYTITLEPDVFDAIERSSLGGSGHFLSLHYIFREIAYQMANCEISAHFFLLSMYAISNYGYH